MTCKEEIGVSCGAAGSFPVSHKDSVAYDPLSCVGRSYCIGAAFFSAQVFTEQLRSIVNLALSVKFMHPTTFSLSTSTLMFAMDLVGLLSMSARREQYILLVHDYTTRYRRSNPSGKHVR